MDNTTTDMKQVKSEEGTPSTKYGGTNLWKPGTRVPGAGRPKGAKNKSTLITQQIQELLLSSLQAEANKLLTVALEKAMDGDRVLLKFFLERFLPAASGNEKGLDTTKGNIQIIISPLTPPPEVSIEGSIIDASPEQEDESNN